MSISALDPRLEKLILPYFGEAESICDASYIISDLGVTGSDYLDFVGDVEKHFHVNLHTFLVGPEPKYVGTGLAGILTGERKKPVYRDFTIAELNEFLRGTEITGKD